VRIVGSLEERVEELEKKVSALENLLSITSQGENKEWIGELLPPKTKLNSHQSVKELMANFSNQQQRQPQQQQHQPQQQRPQQQQQQQTQQQRPQQQLQPQQNNIGKKNSKIREEIFGKYIIGALASLLIFVAAASFIALVWGRISSEIKLLFLVLASMILITIGFVRIKKHNNSITSILLGTGSGLLFISISAAYMAFDFIGSLTAFALAAGWAIFFILSYKYTQTFFTTIIAYIGSYLATFLGLTLVKSNMDYIVVIIFVISIASSMLISGYKWLNHKRQLLCTILTLFSIISIYVFGSFENAVIPNWIPYFIILVILIHGLTNRIFYLVEKSKMLPAHLIVGICVELITFVGLFRLNDSIGSTKTILVFIFILVTQLLINEWKSYSITVSLTVIYSTFLVFAVLAFQITQYNCTFGISLVVLLLLLIDSVKGKTKHHSRYTFLELIIILCDTLLVLISNTLRTETNNLVYIVNIILLIGVVTCLLYEQYKYNRSNNLVMLKVIGFFAFLVNIYFLVNKVILLLNGTEDMISGSVIGYLCITIVLLLFMKSGYFNFWNHPDFKWFCKNKEILQDQSQIAFYILTTIIYFTGLIGLRELLLWYEQLIMIFSVLCVALLQTLNLFRFNIKLYLIGIWIGLKYTILAWTILHISFHTPFNSVIISLIGLILALLSIMAGFLLKVKSIRMYGLILTLLMALKFILVDLSQENSVIRVIALLVGGFICFGISVLYNRLNNIVTQDDNKK
jgi:hypothetical protein